MCTLFIKPMFINTNKKNEQISLTVKKKECYSTNKYCSKRHEERSGLTYR